MLSLLVSTLALASHLGGGGGLPMKTPAAVGMSSARLAKIDHVVERGISAGGYPGAAVVVGRRGAIVWEKSFGKLSWESGSAPVIADETIYDLASLTKVVGTTTATMVLFDEGKIHLDDPVSKYVPEFSGGAKDQVTIRMLLEHRSGLPAGRDLWRIAHTPAEARQAVISTPLVCAPNKCYEYSDLGADMLGFVVEAASGQSLDAFLQDHVFAPLGMTETFFRPADSLKSRVAPTEVAPPRGYPLQGEVHDENAFALGGIAGHAGLFSTASDLAVFAQMMLNGGEYNGTRIVADSTVTLFTTRAPDDGTRALGWDTCNDKGSCGKYLSDHAFGHTGFTGTSMWVDPERDMFVILLTNRVHEPKAKRPAKVIADVRADLSDAAALAVTDYADGPMTMPTAFRADRQVDWNRPIHPVRRHTTKKKNTKSSRSSKSLKNSKSSKSSKSVKSSSSTKAKASATKSAKRKKAVPSSATKAAAHSSTK